ncbi:MAG: acyl-CoA synthetase FdrA [Elusimicrobia bacterium]|nr:acyl-CoA synthetase FdrA [Elusimicrobiota bacterium]
MLIKGIIKKGEYFDSVTLMRIGKELSATKGVADAAVVMATLQNKEILKASGLYQKEYDACGDADLIISIKAESGTVLESVIKSAQEKLTQARKKSDAPGAAPKPKSLEDAIKIFPGANLALISVAGMYAADQAMKALQNGLHVMLFSDNVPLEKEIELKKFAGKKGLLVMGPDCGTAIINGVPLAFANVVSRGDIGIVAASGTGLQELSSIISNEGAGISQAIGTGGRDVKKDVGGIMFIDSIRALASDSATKVLLLASKPPHEDVLRKILLETKKFNKPVVAIFLGAGRGKFFGKNIHEAETFEEAALMAVALSKGEDAEDVDKRIAQRNAAINKEAGVILKKYAPRGRGKYLRGLFSGGTFCSEAQAILGGQLKEMHSNAPLGKAKKLANSLESEGHTFIDLGEDEFTVGRPHPMIDFSLRNRKIIEEANDKNTKAILLDVVLGYGSNMNPGTELAPVIKEASKKVPVILSVTGTDRDPQQRGRVISELRQAGAFVAGTNAAASRMAGFVVGK